MSSCDAPTDEELEGLLQDPLFKAMNAYRAARSLGNEEDVANAEDAWREQVRAKIIAQMSGEESTGV